jgi:hypothetical protein
VFRVQSSVFRVQGAGFRVQGAGFRVQGAGFKVQGSRFFFLVFTLNTGPVQVLKLSYSSVYEP